MNMLGEFLKNFDYSALIGAITFLIGLWWGIREFKISKAVSYIERLNSPDMAEVRAKVDEWIESSSNVEERQIALQNDLKLRSDVRLLYNLLTELAISYKYRLVNRRVTRELWNPLLPQYANDLQPYIAFEGKRGMDLGDDLMQFAKTIRGHGKLDSGTKHTIPSPHTKAKHPEKSDSENQRDITMR